MNISSIFVETMPEKIDSVVDALNSINGIEVHFADTETGRIVVTQEAISVDDEVQGLEKIKTLPNVLVAEMVYHYFEKDTDVVVAAPTKSGHQSHPG